MSGTAVFVIVFAVIWVVVLFVVVKRLIARWMRGVK